MVIHAVPSLRVLDLHQVTAAERKAAETALGGRGVLLTVAFGKRCPPHDAAWDAKVASAFRAAPSWSHRQQVCSLPVV